MLGENKDFAESFLFTVMDLNKNGEVSAEELGDVIKQENVNSDVINQENVNSDVIRQENVRFLNESVMILDLSQFSSLLPSSISVKGEHFKF